MRQSRRAEIERREYALAERSAALDRTEQRLRRVHDRVEKRISLIVGQASALGQLVGAAGRELDPQARAALGEAATIIRDQGRAALAELRQADPQPEADGQAR